MKRIPLKRLSGSRATIFKIKNRQGYAAICLKNLTEGKTAAEAFWRLRHPLRRSGFELAGPVPSPQ